MSSPTSGCADCDVHPNGLCDAYPNCGRGRAEEDFVKRLTAPGGILKPHGIMQIIPATPFRPDLLEPLSDEEQREAAQRYIQARYGGESLTSIQAKIIEQIVTEEVDRKLATGPNYTAMIKRKTDGSDPLVQEPKD
jgi:hypothetical protein